MNSLSHLLLGVLFLVMAACQPLDSFNQDTIPNHGDWRALIVSEGQFGYGTGSMTGLTYGSDVFQDLFRTTNERPLGDVPQSLTKIGNYYYIPVNNSQKVEVVDSKTFESVETMHIDQKCIPMHLVPINEEEALLTDQSYMGSSNLFILDLNHGTDRPIVKRTIPLEHSTFQMKVVGDKVFVAGSKMLVFDLDDVTSEGMRHVVNLDGGSVSVGGFTELCLDAKGLLWVLTIDGVACIDPDTEKVLSTVPLDEVDQYRDNISIDQAKRYVYFNVGATIYRLDTANGKTSTLFTHSQEDEPWTTYAIGVSPENTIFMIRVLFGSITRARVFEYHLDGSIVRQYPDPVNEKLIHNYFKAGIFPRFIYFPFK